MSRGSPAVRVLVTIVAIAIGLIGTYLKSHGPSSSRGSPMPTTVAVGQGIVTHVADGDTIDVDLDGDGPASPTRIRLLGIDTPELTGSTSRFGESARQYVLTRTNHQSVTLGFDGSSAKLDKYGRTLAYVYLADGSLLNESLVRDGQAFAHRTLTCGRTASLVNAEEEAHAANRGLWASMTVQLMPEWRQRWLAAGSPTK